LSLVTLQCGIKGKLVSCELPPFDLFFLQVIV